MAKWPLSTRDGYASPEAFRIGSQGCCEASASRHLQFEDRTLYDTRPHSSDLSVTADRRDEMGSGSCILTWLHNETIHLDPDFVDCILHTPRWFQNTKTPLSVPHSPPFPFEVLVLLCWPPLCC